MMFGRQDEEVRERFDIPLPFLRREIALGDAVKRLTDSFGLRQCGGCGERQRAMNERVVFRPFRSLWED